MTPLQFAAKCAAGLIHGVWLGIKWTDASTVFLDMELRRVHAVATWNAWQETFGETRVLQSWHCTDQAWRAALLSALTEQTTATHHALPDGSVPEPVADSETGVHRV
jgi:hypothetical protein